MSVTTKKAAAIIATMIDKEVAGFKTQVESAKKELSVRIDVIEKLVEKLSQQGSEGDFVTKGDLKKETNKIADKTIIKVEDFEREFENEKKNLYEILGEARLKLEELKRISDVIDDKSRNLDSFMKDFVKRSQEVFDLGKKLEKENIVFNAETNTRVSSVEKGLKSVEKRSLDKAILDKKVSEFKKEMSDDFQRNMISLEKRREDLDKLFGSLEEKVKGFESKMKNYAELSEINKINTKLGKLSNIEASKKEMDKAAAKMERKIFEYDTTMKGTKKMIKAYDASVEGVKNGLNKLESAFSGIHFTAQSTNKLAGQVTEDLASMRGKMGILEQYYRDPDRWIGEKIKSWFSQETTEMKNLVNATNSSLITLKSEIFSMMITLSLTRLANSDDHKQIASEARVLEYVLSEMKNKNILHSELEEYIEQTLSNTRDFWEIRNGDIASLLQSVLDRIKSV